MKIANKIIGNILGKPRRDCKSKNEPDEAKKELIRKEMWKLVNARAPVGMKIL